MGIKGWLDRLGGRREQEPPVAPPPPAPALPASAGLGFALVDDVHGDDACVGCGLCAAVCPVGVITLQGAPLAPSPTTGRVRGWLQAMTIAPQDCVACELCMQVCPTDALRLFPDMRTPAAAPARPSLDRSDLRQAASQVRLGRRRSPLGSIPGAPGAAPPAPRPPAPRPRPAIGLRGPLRPSPDPVELTTDEDRTHLEAWRAPHGAELETEPVGATDGEEIWTEAASAFEPTPPLPEDLLPCEAAPRPDPAVPRAEDETSRVGPADTAPLPGMAPRAGRSGPVDTAPLPERPPRRRKKDRDN
ncbi:MAG: 4Fe-4S binding protein [Alphaproteobacteria bacterium]|nr:4Fe-4S binding protein [Alphaproteobacteria bacterium]